MRFSAAICWSLERPVRLNNNFPSLDKRDALPNFTKTLMETSDATDPPPEALQIARSIAVLASLKARIAEFDERISDLQDAHDTVATLSTIDLSAGQPNPGIGDALDHLARASDAGAQSLFQIHFLPASDPPKHTTPTPNYNARGTDSESEDSGGSGSKTSAYKPFKSARARKRAKPPPSTTSTTDQPPKKQKQRTLVPKREGGPIECFSCGAKSTPEWRNMEDDDGVLQTYCNACGLRIKRKRQAAKGFSSPKRKKTEAGGQTLGPEKGTFRPDASTGSGSPALSSGRAGSPYLVPTARKVAEEGAKGLEIVIPEDRQRGLDTACSDETVEENA